MAQESNEQTKLELDYPCHWSYKAIGKEPNSIQAAVIEIFDGLEHTIELSRSSSGGKYSSFNIHTVVESEAQRLALGEALSGHPAIRLVL